MANVVVVGAGHNGLVAACRLADAGHEVTVLERRAVVGGAVLTHRFDCGCYVNVGANAFGMLAEPIRSLLASEDLMPDVTPADPSFVVRIDDDRVLALHGDPTALREHLRAVAPGAVDGFLALLRDLTTATTAIADLWEGEPCTLAHLRDRLTAIGRPLGEIAVDGSLRDVLRAYLPDDESLDVLAAATTTLFPASSADPFTALPLLYLGQSTVHGLPGWGAVVGGFDTLTNALAAYAEQRGARIATATTVTELFLRDYPAVRLHDGEYIECDAIFGAIDPWHLAPLITEGPPLTELLNDTSDHDGGCAKVNLLVRGDITFPPDIIAAAGGPPPMLVVMPSLDYLDAAYYSYLETGTSTDPYIELTFPHVLDETATCGAHTVISAFLLFAMEAPPDGLERQIQSLQTSVLRVLSRDLGVSADDVLWIETLTPRDLRVMFGMHRGNVDHGPMRPPNIFTHRPFAAGATTETILNAAGLWLCSAGTHPGGLVSGLPGWRAASRFVREHMGA